jgi:hypothetical protein
VVGQLSEFICEMPYKYNDPGNPIVTVEINSISLPNTLIDLGTQTMIDLADKLVISPAKSLDDVTVTLASYTYTIDFLVIYSKSSSKPVHPLVLGRPWLATADAFISCQSGEMIISNGTHSQKSCPLSSCPIDIGDTHLVRKPLWRRRSHQTPVNT